MTFDGGWHSKGMQPEGCRLTRKVSSPEGALLPTSHESKWLNEISNMDSNIRFEASLMVTKRKILKMELLQMSGWLLELLVASHPTPCYTDAQRLVLV